MFNPRKNKKLSYILNLLICIICFWILPNYILKAHPFWGFVVGVIVATVISDLIGAYWTPWKSIKETKNN
jgi:uncharacterized BrkB/YihY/UPF0761 family membrane protein